MTYRQNGTAIGVYRTLEGTGIEIVVRRGATAGGWANFRPAPAGWAAYDKEGGSWRISEAEAAAIIGEPT